MIVKYYKKNRQLAKDTEEKKKDEYCHAGNKNFNLTLLEMIYVLRSSDMAEGIQCVVRMSDVADFAVFV